MTLVAAARLGNLAELRTIVARHEGPIPPQIISRAMAGAIENNQRGTLRWLMQRYMQTLPRNCFEPILTAMDGALRANRRNLINILISNDYFASRLSHQKYLEWCIKLSQDLWLPQLRLLLENSNSHVCYEAVCVRAAVIGQNNVMRFILSQYGRKINSYALAIAFEEAAKRNHLQTLMTLLGARGLTKSHFNIMLISLLLNPNLPRPILLYLLAHHKDKMENEAIQTIYQNAPHLRRLIAREFTRNVYAPNWFTRMIQFIQRIEIEKWMLEAGWDVPLWRTFKKSVFNGSVAVVASLLLTPLLWLQISYGVFAVSLLTLMLRDKIKAHCEKSYQEKSVQAQRELAPNLRNAFKEGCEAAKSYGAQAKSWLPTRDAFWHPKAYYAGFEAMRLKKDNKSIGENAHADDARQLIRRVAP